MFKWFRKKKKEAKDVTYGKRDPNTGLVDIIVMLTFTPKQVRKLQGISEKIYQQQLREEKLKRILDA